ncbi:TOBE domain-containing protein [Caulobacter sp. S45]|jgi:molybdate transport system regulatory protein|uniref:TOBE domain-containing protein n=1 Tax=Caulobacter sp. S45 TaxID=1641861 RepID=UPI00131E5CE2|nr:TOBE domain-containing protein [Caulobacter sp. S45]
MVDTLTANIVFDSGIGRVGPERIGVLDAIDQTGSITGAGKLLGLSYRGCWDAVQALNNLFGEQLVATSPGGQATRGAVLTDAGRRLLSDYRELQQEMAEVVERLRARLGPRANKVSTLPLVSVRSTARNVWRAVISTLIEGPIIAEVGLALAPGVDLIATVPVRSLADLALAPGSSVLALVNPNGIVLAKSDIGRTSARNQLTGVVIRREDTVAGSEITLDLGGGKTLFATMGAISAAELDFKEGERACALVKATEVTLFAT